MATVFTNTASSDDKPSTHFQNLIDSLISQFKVSKGTAGQRYHLIKNEQKMCFLLIKGHCDVKRGSDSLLLTTIQSPSIMGLTYFEHDASTVTQAKDNIEYIYASREEIMTHIKDNNLWESSTHILMFISARFHEYLNANVSVPTYDLICNQLQALTQEKFEIRATVSAVKYIMDRTSLSRSGVMKVLSSLDKGGYIVIKRGLLIQINRLPEKY